MHPQGLVVERRSSPSSVATSSYSTSALACTDANRTKGLGHLLEQQLGSIRYRELRHLLGAFAIRAPSVVPHQTTVFTGVNLKFVGRDHEPL